MEEDRSDCNLRDDEFAGTCQNVLEGKMPEIDDCRESKLGENHGSVSDKEENPGFRVDKFRSVFWGEKQKRHHSYVQDDEIIEDN